MGSRRAGEFRGPQRFVVRRRVGSGGMGVVYEAYDVERDMRVAIKTIRDAEASTLYRFKKEFRSLTDISHPNLVKIHELVLSDELCFYTMEFVDGVDFLRYVCPEQPPSPDNPLSDTMETYVALESTNLTDVTARSGTATDPGSRPSGPGAQPIPDKDGGPGASAKATEPAEAGAPGRHRPSSTEVVLPADAHQGSPPVNGAPPVDGAARSEGDAEEGTSG